jgi:outer membrane protein assembly factor BamB
MKKEHAQQMQKNLLSHFVQSKRKVAISILICLLLCASSILDLPRRVTARASANSAQLLVSPESSTYPRQLKVSGTNYGAVEKVQVYWNYTGPGTGTLERTATTNASGAFSASFYAPLTPTGSYTIAGVGMTSGLVATAAFQLLPGLQVSPVAGIAGAQLTLTGQAFGSGESVNIYWNYNTKTKMGTLLAAVPADSTGFFTYTFNAPAGTPSKRITIAGIGQTSQAAAFATFTVYPPTLALAPVQGSATTTLTVSAYGFAANEQINLFWNHGSNVIGTGTTDGTGYLAPTTVAVPAGSVPGNYAVTATGQTSKISTTSTFTVIATASSMNISSGPVGVDVNVNGQGYSPGETVDILWNYTGPGTGTTVAQVTAGVAGTITGNFTVPTAAPGSCTVAVVGTTSQDATQNTFTVDNSLTENPSTAPPGTNVTVVGTGFQANESVALYWDSLSELLLVTATADSNGNISQTVVLPGNAVSGVHSIIGMGLSSQLSLTGQITINTNWSAFGFDYLHDRDNIYENSLTPSNVSNLTLQWSADLGSGFWGSPVYANGIIYQASSRGVLNAFNATTGIPIWQYNTQTVDTEVSAPLVDPATNTVFYGTITQLISSSSDVGLPSPVYGLDAQTGALKWSVIIPADEYGFPSLAFNTLYVGAARELGPGDLLALDMMSGDVKWEYPTHSVWGSVAVDPNTNMVFTGNGNPNAQVLALNAQTGQLDWQYNVPNSPGDTDVGSGIAVVNGLVYANSKNGNVYAINESNGTTAWSTTIAAQYDFADVSSPAISTAGILYIGSTDSNLYALNASTGAIVWKTPLNGQIASSPALANGVVYVATTGNSIYALDATTGSILWSFATENLSYSSPIVVNGWLYCGSDDGKLYAFSL